MKKLFKRFDLAKTILESIVAISLSGIVNLIANFSG
jgi:hypothetical protein